MTRITRQDQEQVTVFPHGPAIGSRPPATSLAAAGFRAERKSRLAAVARVRLGRERLSRPGAVLDAQGITCDDDIQTVRVVSRCEARKPNADA